MDAPHMIATVQPLSATSTQPMIAINAFRQDAWTCQDPRLPYNWATTLNPQRHRDSALCNDYARRQTPVEIDVLAAKALGLALDEFQTIHSVQFPVMRQYKSKTDYDTTDRIVFTPSKGFPDVGLPGKAVKGGTSYTLTTLDGTKENIRRLDEGTIIRHTPEDTRPDGPIERHMVYHAPFDNHHRETDYSTSWQPHWHT